MTVSSEPVGKAHLHGPGSQVNVQDHTSYRRYQQFPGSAPDDVDIVASRLEYLLQFSEVFSVLGHDLQADELVVEVFALFKVGVGIREGVKEGVGEVGGLLPAGNALEPDDSAIRSCLPRFYDGVWVAVEQKLATDVETSREIAEQFNA